MTSPSSFGHLVIETILHLTSSTTDQAPISASKMAARRGSQVVASHTSRALHNGLRSSANGWRISAMRDYSTETAANDVPKAIRVSDRYRIVSTSSHGLHVPCRLIHPNSQYPLNVDANPAITEREMRLQQSSIEVFEKIPSQETPVWQPLYVGSCFICSVQRYTS